MRVLFTACPMFGHVNTLVPLARAAQRAGHEVVLATGADHVGRVERIGFAAWAVGPTYAEAGWPPRSPLDFVTAADKRCVDLLPRAQAWRPDLVVHEEIEAAGAIVAARTGARHVTHGLGIAVGGGQALDPILDDLGARWEVDDLAAMVRDAPYLSICPPTLRPPGWPTPDPCARSPPRPGRENGSPTRSRRCRTSGPCISRSAPSSPGRRRSRRPCPACGTCR
jgi:hypothetical protein